MIDKEKLFGIENAIFDPKDLPQDMKNRITSYFPVYFSENEEEAIEEVEYCIEELKKIIDEQRDNKKIINYIAYKATLMAGQCPFVNIASLYEKLIAEMKLQTKRLSNIVEGRKSMYFPENSLPNLKSVIRSLSAGGSLNNILLMKSLSKQGFLFLLKDIFRFYHGRIPKSEQLLVFYPDVMEKVFKVHRQIMLDDGPLPLDWRYFIAISAVSCYQCEYLYYLLLGEFEEAGGNVDWLNNEKNVLPEKLRCILDIIYGFAYSPWTFYKEKKNVISSLVKGTNSTWTRQEYIQLILIISFYHSYASFVLSMGVMPELDFPRDYNKNKYLRANDEEWRAMLESSPLNKKSTNEIVMALKNIADNIEKEKPMKGKDKLSNKSAIPEDEDFSWHATSNPTPLYRTFFGKNSAHFLSFDSRKLARITSDDYSWKIQGYAHISEYSEQLAQDINEKYDYIFKMTLGSFGEEKGIQTEPFRQSVIYYLELIHGYEHLEFDYKQINMLLPKEFKAAIKTMCSLPQNMNIEIFQQIPIAFKDFEMIHIGLLVMESKFQIELMYGLLLLELE